MGRGQRRPELVEAERLGRDRTLANCRRHGRVEFVLRQGGGWRCLKCRSEAVSRRRRRMKAMLVAEAGGGCAICGYKRCPAALQFHHLEPGNKSFVISRRGVTRSLDEARAEAAKCVLLCANCHAEVEVGMTPVTLARDDPG